jgi:YTH domain-containing family protein
VQQHPAVNPEHPQHQQVIDAHTQSTAHSPLSPHFRSSHLPSPPPAGTDLRRHQSLTHTGGGPRPLPPASGLKRSGTFQAQIKQSQVSQAQHSPSPPNAEEEYAGEDYYEEDPYFARSPVTGQQQQVQTQGQGQYPTSPMGRSSPWNANALVGEWRTPSGSNNNATIDDIQRALSALELASNSNQMYPGNANFQAGQSAHPPRFLPNPPLSTQAGLRNNNNTMPNNNHNTGVGSSSNLQLVTDFDGRKTPLAPSHPVSAAAYIPVIGHSVAQQQHQQLSHQPQRSMTSDERMTAASSVGSWDQKDRSLGSRGSNPNLQYGYQQQAKAGIPNVPSIPQQYLQQQQQQQQQQAGTSRLSVAALSQGQGQGQGFANSPVDVPSLIATKGYNPINFDVRPQFVSRYRSPLVLLTQLMVTQRPGSLSLSRIQRMTCTSL